ncbi:DNA-binding transcriptional regulator [Vagococcus sp. PNs007]|uniref:DNA-binding transcriptional regulator n=1 Tax=Vagococcus proximus TaxID=2991417 RepID=A0ABT5WZH0_9ENTE|nr:sugar-binding domain-containing protein [Vagococcus proximus]MDF0479052.1 DNA-binding transcriptional regulator [Vagococcus proximus]
MDNNLDNDELLVNLSEDYYLKNIPITDLTKKYNLSRYKILKNLEQAIDTGVVSITINSPFSRNKELEAFFNRQFQTNVKVLKNTENITEDDGHFWDFCAKTVQSRIDQSQTVALSWGDSVYKVIEQFKNEIREDLTFTQFIGEVGKYHSLAGSLRLVQKAASKFEANYLTLSAPLYIMNDDVRELLALEPIINTTLSAAKKADLLLTGLATPSSITSVDAWNQNKELVFGPQFKEAIGMVYGRPYDINGQFLNQAHDKTFGLSLVEILQIPKRIAICNNKFKANPCLGALNGNFFTDMIIDEKTALKIMQHIKRGQTITT